MKRLLTIMMTLNLVLGTTAFVNAETVTLTFDSDVPGTIQDKNGMGTGFTHRLPATGTAIDENDPNLDLLVNPGYLTIRPTYSDIATRPEWLPDGQHASIMEAFGIMLPGVGMRDVTVTAIFRNIHLFEGSDQLTLYVGATSNLNVRAGLHRSFTESWPQYFMNMKWGPNVAENHPSWVVEGNWSNTQDVVITLKRRNGLWSIAWQNLTNFDVGSSEEIRFPEMESENDLYVGVHYASPRSGVNEEENSQIEEFSVM